MINLGHCNVVGESHIPSWQTAAKEAGLDPSVLSCVIWQEAGGKAPATAVAWFRVRSRDPACYLVPRQ